MASEDLTASVKVGLANLRVYTVYLKRMISLFVFSPSRQIRIFINVLYLKSFRCTGEPEKPAKFCGNVVSLTL